MKKLKLIPFLFFWASLLYSFSAAAVEKKTSGKYSAAEAEDGNLVVALFKDKHYKFAAKEADNYLKKYPEGIFALEILFIRAQLYVIDNFTNSALFNYKQIINKYPDSVYYQDSLYFSGVLAIELGEEKTGEHYLKLLKKTFPQSKYNSKLEYYFGKIAFKEKKWSKAEKQFKSSLKTSSLTKKQKLEAENYLAWSYYFQGKKKWSGKLLIKLLDSDIRPRLKARISFHLAKEAYKKDEYERAAFWWQKLLEKWPHPAFKHKAGFWLAETLYLIHKQFPSKVTREQKEKAIRLYGENLSSEKPLEIFVSHYHRAWLSLAVSQPSKADSDFKLLRENSAKQGKNIDLHSLGIGIIRSFYKLNDCENALKFQARKYFDKGMRKLEEVRYYVGKCHFKQKQWIKARKEFSRVALESKLGSLMFRDYLETFIQTNDFAGGLRLLKKAEAYPAVLSPKEKILTLKAEFCLKFKKWLMALETMEQIISAATGNKENPELLINIAKTYRQIAKTYENKKTRKYPNKLKPIKFYRRQAATYYEKAYYQLPDSQKETKLAILAFLIEHYENEKNLQKASLFYQKAIPLIQDQKHKAKLRIRAAKILIAPLKKIKEAKEQLLKLHNKADQEANYEASSLLAEILIKEKKYSQAIKTLEELSGRPIYKTRRAAKVHYRLGELYQFKEEWKKAVRHYSLAIKAPNSAALRQQAEKRLSNIENYLNKLKKAKDAS